jgi:hypothetical protein
VGRCSLSEVCERGAYRRRDAVAGGAGRNDRRPVPPGVQYYARTVRDYYPLAYDAAGSRGPTNWRNYYPGASLVDVVAIDYYATAFVNGIRLDTIVAIADDANPPKPFGIREMGNSTGAASRARSQMEACFS